MHDSKRGSQHGQAETVGQGIDLLAGPAHGALLGGAGDISGDVVRGEKTVHRDAVHLFQHAEDGGNALDLAAVILDTLQGAPGALAGVDGGDQDQHLPPHDHGGQVVPEDQLPVGVILRGDYVNVFAAVDGKDFLFGQVAGEERADDLAPVQTYDGVHPLVIGVVLGQGHGSFPGHGELVLHAGDVDVVAVVGVPGGKMPLEDRHLKLGVESRCKLDRVHILTSRLVKSVWHIRF